MSTRRYAATLSVLTLAALAGFGCAARRPQAAVVERPAARPAPAGPTIVELRGRHEVITVTASPDGSGPRYSARTHDGEVLVSNATLDQLRDEHPDILRRIDPAIAAKEDVAAHGRATIPAGTPIADHAQR